LKVAKKREEKLKGGGTIGMREDRALLWNVPVNARRKEERDAEKGMGE